MQADANRRWIVVYSAKGEVNALNIPVVASQLPSMLERELEGFILFSLEGYHREEYFHALE